MNSHSDTPPPNKIDLTNIAQTISASADREKQTLSPDDESDAQKAIDEEMRQISQSDYEDLLKYILFTIGAIGLFLIVISCGAAFNENSMSEQQAVIAYPISDCLLGFGVELLAGAGLVSVITFVLAGKATVIPSIDRTWAQFLSQFREPIVISGCLILGCILAVVPSFFKNASWSLGLMQSAGIEIFGGGVLFTLFENFERKFKGQT